MPSEPSALFVISHSDTSASTINMLLRLPLFGRAVAV